MPNTKSAIRRVRRVKIQTKINNISQELSKRKLKPDLLKTVKKFREDELEHHDTGVEHQAEMTTGYVLLSKTIKQLCYTAIKITKKY